MNRRDFLKLGGILSSTVFIHLNPISSMVGKPIEARLGKNVYRGTGDGKIYLSNDAGKSWKMYTDFGTEFSVVNMAADSNNIHAELGYAGYTFQLILSPNNKIWRTV